MRIINTIQRLQSLLVCLLIIASLAIVKHGEFMGYELMPKAEQRQAVSNDTLRVLDNGTVVVNTTNLAPDVIGYAGKVPLEITLKDGIVQDVRAKDNAETKEFFEQAATLLGRWKGKSVDEAMQMKVDAVSGATFSSNAIIENVQRGLTYAKQKGLTTGEDEVAEGSDASSQSKALGFELSAKSVAGLLVVLLAAILPLFVKNKKYRLCQSVLNVVVLGFWCGSFLSYTSLIGYAAHGINSLALIVPVGMLIVAFIYPLFGKKSYYCTNVCPFGSLQYLAGKCVKYKVRMSQKTMKRLDLFRQILWALLMLSIWSGVWSDWMDYEPFSAFLFLTASWVTLVIAIAFFLLSFVVMRPYCRFVCPMGTLLKYSQSESLVK